MKQWKCIQCGALFTTPTDAQPFPMTCNACRAANPPSHAQFLRPPSTGGPVVPPQRTPSPRGGLASPLPGPVPLPGAPIEKVHTSSVTQMLKRSKTRTNLPAVPHSPPHGSPSPTPPAGGRRRSTSVVGGFAQQAAEARAHEQAPARSGKKSGKAVVIMFLGVVVAVIGIGVAIVIGMENPTTTTTNTTDVETAATSDTPTPTPTNQATGPTPPPTGGPAPAAPAGASPAPTPPPPRELTPYELMQQQRRNNPAPPPPPVPAIPTPAPAPLPVANGARLTRLECATADEANGRWKRVRHQTDGADTLWNWDNTLEPGQFPFFQWRPSLDCGRTAWLRIRYKTTGVTSGVITINALADSGPSTSVELPAGGDTQNQWREFEGPIHLQNKLEQIEIRPKTADVPTASISVDWVEIHTAKPAAGPAAEAGPIGPVAALTAQQIATFLGLVKTNDLAGIKQMVAANGGYLTCRDENDYSPLHWAARRDAVEIVNYFVAAGVPVDILQKARRTPLQQAAENGMLGALEALMALGADINAADDENRPPLYWAMANDQQEVMKRLLQRGANPNLQRVVNGDTLLHDAAQRGAVAQIRILLDGGADPKIKNTAGRNPAEEADAAKQPLAAQTLKRALGIEPGGPEAAAPAANPNALLHLDGAAADLANGRRWQNGTLATENGVTFATWTRNAEASQGALQYTDNEKDIVDIPPKVKLNVRIRLTQTRGPMTIKIYMHRGEETEASYGAYTYNPKVADGEWEDFECVIGGPAAGPLRTIEFKVENQAMVAGSKVDIDRVELTPAP